MTKKIRTYKSGNFIFSKEFSNEKLSGVLIEAKILFKTISDLPILPELSTRLEEEIIRRSIFGTAALEGNPLNEEEVAEIIAEPSKVKKPERGEKEIQNLKSVYDFVRDIKIPSTTPFPIEEALIKKVHAIITRGIRYYNNEPGVYRNTLVKVGDADHGGVYTPPKCLPDIKTLMKEFFSWMNSEEIITLPPEIRAAMAHYYLGLIHPFGDGNGRTARIIEALLLRMSGIRYVPVMLSNFYYRNIDDYFLAFSNARKNKGDITPFLEFVLRGVVESLNEIRERIVGFIRRFSLRDYYSYLKSSREITQRQHDFLIMLLDYTKPFILEDLFTVSPLKIIFRKVSERTARRDLKKLCEKDLLILTEKSKYDLNTRVLG